MLCCKSSLVTDSLHMAFGHPNLQISHHLGICESLPHCEHNKSLLQEFFGDCIIRHGLWPPQSPHLTPPDFFLWGFLKEKVYSWSLEEPRINTHFAREYSMLTSTELLCNWQQQQPSNQGYIDSWWKVGGSIAYVEQFPIYLFSVLQYMTVACVVF
jgi:hypothetical protein